VKWQAAVRALDDWMLTDIGLGRREIESAIYDSDPGERIALARISQHGCQTLFDRAGPRSDQ
jgi:hypothetical protein